MRHLTEQEIDLVEWLLDDTLSHFVGTRTASDLVLGEAVSRLAQASREWWMKYPTFPTMEWRAEFDIRSYIDPDGYIQKVRTGDLIARPVRINGEVIKWG